MYHLFTPTCELTLSQRVGQKEFDHRGIWDVFAGKRLAGLCLLHFHDTLWAFHCGDFHWTFECSSIALPKRIGSSDTSRMPHFNLPAHDHSWDFVGCDD